MRTHYSRPRTCHMRRAHAPRTLSRSSARAAGALLAFTRVGPWQHGKRLLKLNFGGTDITRRMASQFYNPRYGPRQPLAGHLRCPTAVVQRIAGPKAGRLPDCRPSGPAATNASNAEYWRWLEHATCSFGFLRGLRQVGWLEPGTRMPVWGGFQLPGAFTLEGDERGEPPGEDGAPLAGAALSGRVGASVRGGAAAAHQSGLSTGGAAGAGAAGGGGGGGASGLRRGSTAGECGKEQREGPGVASARL